MPVNITILGLNAVGAGLGMAFGTLDQQALQAGRPRITGWDANHSIAKDARGLLMVDREARDVADAVREADVVIVCVPPSEIEATFIAITPHLKAGAIVSDTAPVKAFVLRLAAEHLPEQVDFVGGHPLISGADRPHSDAAHDMFRGALYCLIPTVQTGARAINALDTLVSVIGAKPYYLEPAEHDSYVAATRQQPLVTAAALMLSLSSSGAWREIQALAGTELRDATKLAAAVPQDSVALLQQNHEAVARWIDGSIRALVELRDSLDDRQQLEGLLHAAHEEYERMAAAQPNMRPGEADFVGQQPEPPRGFTSLLFGQRPRKDKK
jgi:prephenate dehydrogenase